MRIFIAGLRKMVGRPASFVSVALLVGLLGLIMLASATVGQQDDSPRGAAAARALLTFPGAYDFILSFLFGLGGLVAVNFVPQGLRAEYGKARPLGGMAFVRLKVG